MGGKEGKVFRNYKGHMDKTKRGQNQGREVWMAGMGGKCRQLYLTTIKKIIIIIKEYLVICPGWVAQLVRVSSQYTKVPGSTPSQSSHKNQPMNAYISRTTHRCSLSL